MARWKANSDGTGYYDPNDSGPDQYTPTAAERAKYEQPKQAQYNTTTATNPAFNYSTDGSEQLEYGKATTAQGGITGAGTYQPPSSIPQGGWQYMEGVDQNKLNDFSHTTPKYVASRILASGGSLQDAANAIGATVLDQDKIRLPDGTIVDTRRDVEGANQLQWTVTYDPNAPQGNAAGASGIGGSGSSSSGAGLGSGSSAANDLWNMLMARAKQGTQINPNDPNITPAVDAYRAEQERGARNYISDQAEAQGPYANLSGERRIANEHAAQATGSMRSQLILNELQNRRDEIQNALTSLGSLLSDQQRYELSAELGRINANLQQQQVTNQNNQFLDQLGLQATDRANYWDAINSGRLAG